MPVDDDFQSVEGGLSEEGVKIAFGDLSNGIHEVGWLERRSGGAGRAGSRSSACRR